VRAQASPEGFDTPASRRGRIQLRIALRRLAQQSRDGAVAGWLARFDPAAENDAQADISPE
jgi:hypothetical protein